MAGKRTERLTCVSARRSEKSRVGNGGAESQLCSRILCWFIRSARSKVPVPGDVFTQRSGWCLRGAGPGRGDVGQGRQVEINQELGLAGTGGRSTLRTEAEDQLHCPDRKISLNKGFQDGIDYPEHGGHTWATSLRGWQGCALSTPDWRDVGADGNPDPWKRTRSIRKGKYLLNAKDSGIFFFWSCFVLCLSSLFSL